jgi:hypothetical protein
VLRPYAAEITWINEALLAVGFVVVSWLWMRLRETPIALTDLERQQIVEETQLTLRRARGCTIVRHSTMIRSRRQVEYSL